MKQSKFIKERMGGWNRKRERERETHTYKNRVQYFIRFLQNNVKA